VRILSGGSYAAVRSQEGKSEGRSSHDTEKIANLTVFSANAQTMGGGLKHGLLGTILSFTVGG